VSFFIDTHCHLNFNSFQDDLPQVLDRARENGIREILIPGTDLSSSQSAVELCGQYNHLFAAVGVHPNDTDEWNPGTVADLRKLAGNSRVKAIGEIGLDYYREKTEPDKQKMIFSAQLELAKELNLPVVVHNRNSVQDLWPILKEWAAGFSHDGPQQNSFHGVLHSFDGSDDLAQEAFENGFLLGISGPVTYKNARDRQESVAHIPLEAMILETDAPFLTPHPHRGHRNEPAYIPLIAQEIARIKNIDLAEVQLITSNNALQLFSLGSID
jgi:TatD DNase family protein